MFYGKKLKIRGGENSNNSNSSVLLKHSVLHIPVSKHRKIVGLAHHTVQQPTLRACWPNPKAACEYGKYAGRQEGVASNTTLHSLF